MTVLDVTGVTVRFGGVVALRDVDLSVRTGEIHGIIGPNGAGKTTLFNAISGFHAPASGAIRVRGVDVCGLPPHRRAALGLVRTFQHVGLALDHDVVTNLVMAQHRAWRRPLLSSFPCGRTARRERARLVDRSLDVLDALNLGWTAPRLAGALPHGTLKVVELAAALLRDPVVLLLDEPSSGLGPAETDELASIVTTINRCRGVTVVLIEHDVPFVSGIADRLTALSFGEVLASGDPSEVVADEQVHTAYLGTATGDGVLVGAPR